MLMTRRGIVGLSDDLRAQRDFLAERAPVYGRLLELLGDRLEGELGRRLASAWAEREFVAFYDRPLLLLASLRDDALREGSSHPLYAALVEDPPRVEAVTEGALAAATTEERELLWRTVARRWVQTNETSRAIAWLWPAHLMSEAGVERPLALVDLGASAGLNLVADALPPMWSDETGEPIPLSPRPPVASRAGLDLAPLDVREEDDARWLRACVWPGDTARLERLELGIAAFHAEAARSGALALEAGPLTAAVEHLRRAPDDTTVLAVQTIVRDYLPARDRERYERSMRAWLVERPPLSSLWCELEVEDPSAPPERSAALTVHLRGRDGALSDVVIARCHPHPRRLWRDLDGLGALRRCFHP